ncbi:MAG: macro domain-containing protein [Gemmatimonadota bacterium]
MRPIRTDLDPVSAVSRDVMVAAGSGAEERLRRMDSMPLGGAVITPAGDLASSFLVHVVVMSAEESMTTSIVQRAVKNAFGRAADLGIESLAFPPLGLGVGNVEPEVSADVLLELFTHHLDEGRPPRELEVVVSTDFEADLFERLLSEKS